MKGGSGIEEREAGDDKTLNNDATVRARLVDRTNRWI